MPPGSGVRTSTSTSTLHPFLTISQASAGRGAQRTDGAGDRTIEARDHIGVHAHVAIVDREVEALEVNRDDARPIQLGQVAAVALARPLQERDVRELHAGTGRALWRRAAGVRSGRITGDPST